MKKTNILHLLTGLGLGGAEKFVLDLAFYANKSKYNVFILGMSKNNTLLHEFLIKKINVYSLNIDNYLINFFPIVRRVFRFVKKNNIEIIHAHMFHSIIIACTVKIFCRKIRIIYTPHNVNIGSIWREIVVWFLRPLREIDIAFSEKSVKFFYKKNYQFIPNGVDVDKFKKLNKGSGVFCFISVGRLEPVKNYGFLIECAKKLREKRNFTLYIVGEGFLRKDLERMIQQYKMGACIKLLGARNDVATLLGRSSCFLMPSLWEGMPISLLEAGACGLPIISTPVGDIPSLIDCSCGYLSTEDDFCKTMDYVMSNYDEAEKKAACFQKKVIEYHSINKIVRKHENLYEKVCLKDKNLCAE